MTTPEPTPSPASPVAAAVEPPAASAVAAAEPAAAATIPIVAVAAPTAAPVNHVAAAEQRVRLGRDRPTQPRLVRELETIEAMTRIYCADHHGKDGVPCAECKELMVYAAKRLAVCPFGAEKPVCAKCQVHCYGKVMREKVREVMRYAGPRMTWRHPIMAIAHLLDKRYVAPPKPSARRKPPA